MDCKEEQSYSGDKVKELNKTLEKREIDWNKSLPVHLENKVKELHTNVRHITQLAMTWFAFFVSTNYLSLGWFAKDVSSESGSSNPLIVYTVAGVFIVQNLLGTVGIWMVRKMAKDKAAQVSAYENWLLTNKNLLEETASEIGIWERFRTTLGKLIPRSSTKDKTTTKSQIEVLYCPSIPTTLYKLIAWFLQLVLVSLIAAWGLICYLKYLNGS